MRFRILSAVLLLGCMPSLLFAQEAGSAAELYIEGLEELLDEDETAAARRFEQVIADFPETAYAEDAAARLDELALKRDTSGLVGFYTGTLLTGVYVTTGVPILFELGTVATGASGIIGIGGSLYLSSVLTRDVDIALGTQLWTDSIQISSIMSYIWGYNLLKEAGVLNLSPEADAKTFWAGSMTTALASRAVGYYLWRDELPPAGKPAAYLSAYTWSNIYISLAMYGVLSIDNTIATNAAHIAVPTASGLLASWAWEKQGWSASRVGMLSVGGAGGMLIGGFVNAILSPLELPEELFFGNIILFGGLGQLTAGLTTSGFEPDPRWENVSLQAAPVIRSTARDAIRLGVEVSIRY